MGTIQKEVTTADKTVIDFFNQFEDDEFLKLHYRQFGILQQAAVDTITLALNNKLIDLIVRIDESEQPASIIQTTRTAYEKIFKTINELGVKR